MCIFIHPETSWREYTEIILSVHQSVSPSVRPSGFVRSISLSSINESCIYQRTFLSLFFSFNHNYSWSMMALLLHKTPFSRWRHIYSLCGRIIGNFTVLSVPTDSINAILQNSDTCYTNKTPIWKCEVRLLHFVLNSGRNGCILFETIYRLWYTGLLSNLEHTSFCLSAPKCLSSYR